MFWGHFAETTQAPVSLGGESKNKVLTLHSLDPLNPLHPPVNFLRVSLITLIQAGGSKLRLSGRRDVSCCSPEVGIRGWNIVVILCLRRAEETGEKTL